MNRKERICKEALVAYFEVLTWHFSGETNENFIILQSRYHEWCPSRE
jgi:hypothetical protein